MLPIAFTEPVTSTQSNPSLHAPSPTPRIFLFFFCPHNVSFDAALQRISLTLYWQPLGNCEGTIWFAMLLSEWISVLVSRVSACTVSAQRKPAVCLAIVSSYCGISVMISYIARLNRNQKHNCFDWKGNTTRGIQCIMYVNTLNMLMSGLFFSSTLFIQPLFRKIDIWKHPATSVTHLNCCECYSCFCRHGLACNQAWVYAVAWAHVERLPGRTYDAQTFLHSTLSFKAHDSLCFHAFPSGRRRGNMGLMAITMVTYQPDHSKCFWCSFTSC